MKNTPQPTHALSDFSTTKQPSSQLQRPQPTQPTQPTLEQLTERTQQLEQRLTIVVSALERLADACGFCADSSDAEYFRRILLDLKLELAQ